MSLSLTLNIHVNYLNSSGHYIAGLQLLLMVAEGALVPDIERRMYESDSNAPQRPGSLPSLYRSPRIDRLAESVLGVSNIPVHQEWYKIIGAFGGFIGKLSHTRNRKLE